MDELRLHIVSYSAGIAVLLSLHKPTIPIIPIIMRLATVFMQNKSPYALNAGSMDRQTG